MLGNIVRSIPSLGNNNVLLKRYNLTRVVLNNIRSKQSIPKYPKTTSETDGNDDIDQPIKYSSSLAASMRINEYRDPYGDRWPWYQPWSIMTSLGVILIYFCILREENDIDLMLNKDLGDSLNQIEQGLAERKKATLAAKGN